MKAHVKWLNNEAINFEAVNETGNTVIMDAEQKLGAKPMELILMGVGGCTSYDVVSILKKGRQAITDVQCELTAQRADAIPAVFTDIHLHFIVKGSNLDEAKVKKAIELSAEKYCSASKMLEAGGVKITHDYEIVEA
ncbi:MULTISPECIES: OsmC family protein [unclassified Moraxella]|uniref:OsmC family protein n=1 Tax=unclassified Moraxella TaxID=2685852 RepID=UPI003AF62969